MTRSSRPRSGAWSESRPGRNRPPQPRGSHAAPASWYARRVALDRRLPLLFVTVLVPCVALGALGVRSLVAEASTEERASASRRRPRSIPPRPPFDDAAGLPGGRPRRARVRGATDGELLEPACTPKPAREPRSATPGRPPTSSCRCWRRSTGSSARATSSAPPDACGEFLKGGAAGRARRLRADVARGDREEARSNRRGTQGVARDRARPSGRPATPAG